ncbi:oxygen-binding di-iron domain-containing protein [Candidatus Venteria ishoeyi]|uniref:Metallo-beta-lactamase superfamily protein n=1 Tax=Candidatus Venteria ishoeyi TaxID=1899563 RepID=A0A1H6FAL6_9GAMM|nr:MBL fold metallo-hydrolase [Candidatus Venteria ishoeyi]MDM8545951.1 MBL fold metallo-hydrolase [Candidatus Venteria ishoeyi]SEH06074.1 Metallo-beta-lactamase superfamily protein [Candidatus Venteria ishoeyi]
MPVEFYNEGQHLCVGFYDLVEGDGVQANQFLIINEQHSVLLDPGGDLTFHGLYTGSYRYMMGKELEYVVGSHQDPDILSSLNQWLLGSKCKIVVPKLWAHFIPHFAPKANVKDRLIEIPDQGMRIDMGSGHSLYALPAHFLHSEGNFQFYDPLSKILFSGDLGASLVETDVDKPVENFELHLSSMEAFHQRYMSGQKAGQLWANMVRELDIEWIVPQHGRPFHGKEMVDKFIQWVEDTPCGLDLMTQDHYKVPDILL